MTRADDFHAFVRRLEEDGVPGCSTTVHRHDVRAEIWAAVKGGTVVTAVTTFVGAVLLGGLVGAVL